MNPSSRKRRQQFSSDKFLHKVRNQLFKICHWNSGIEQSAIYWRYAVAIFPSERIVYNNLQSEELAKQISPTHKGNANVMTMWTINSLISLLSCMHLGQKKLASIWAKKYVQNFFLRQKPVGPEPGAKNSDLSSYLSHLTRHWFEN